MKFKLDLQLFGGVGFDYNADQLAADIQNLHLSNFYNIDTLYKIVGGDTTVSNDTAKLLGTLVERRLNNDINANTFNNRLETFAKARGLDYGDLQKLGNTLYDENVRGGRGGAKSTSAANTKYYLNTLKTPSGTTGLKNVLDERENSINRAVNETGTKADMRPNSELIQARPTLAQKGGTVKGSTTENSTDKKSGIVNSGGKMITGRASRGSQEVQVQKSGKTKNTVALEQGRKLNNKK